MTTLCVSHFWMYTSTVNIARCTWCRRIHPPPSRPRAHSDASLPKRGWCTCPSLLTFCQYISGKRRRETLALAVPETCAVLEKKTHTCLCDSDGSYKDHGSKESQRNKAVEGEWASQAGVLRGLVERERTWGQLEGPCDLQPQRSVVQGGDATWAVPSSDLVETGDSRIIALGAERSRSQQVQLK